MDAAIKEVFKLQIGWFGFQMEPPNDLITENSALGYYLMIILHTYGAVLICMLIAEVLGGAQVPLGD